jgi:hypothetical protein
MFLRLLSLLFLARVLVAQVDLSIDSSEADQALQILHAQTVGKTITPADWQQLFATVPYRQLKTREISMSRPFTDEDFKAFLLSTESREKQPMWERALTEMKQTHIPEIGNRVLAWLPAGATIHARVFPEIKPAHNSFVWSDKGSEPAIFLYLDQQTRAQFENTVAHECHHIGLQSLEKQQNAVTAGLSENVARAVKWMGGFGEGEAMLAAAGSVELHPHHEDNAVIRARWDSDMMHFNADVGELETFFTEILDGKITDDATAMKRAAPFWGDAQGAWYTVGYEMSALVETKYGRQAFVKCLIDPRQLFILYNQIALDARAPGAKLATWSPEFLRRLSPY